MILTTRILLGYLAAWQLLIGGWNQFWPESFYEDFPTVKSDPPFSEHFARDFGGASLAIAVVLIAAAVFPRPLLVIVAGIAYSVFAIPHAVFHAGHLGHDASAEAIVSVLGLVVNAVVGAVVIVLGVLLMRRDRARLHDPAVD